MALRTSTAACVYKNVFAGRCHSTHAALREWLSKKSWKKVPTNRSRIHDNSKLRHTFGNEYIEVAVGKVPRGRGCCAEAKVLSVKWLLRLFCKCFVGSGVKKTRNSAKHFIRLIWKRSIPVWLFLIQGTAGDSWGGRAAAYEQTYKFCNVI